MGRLQKQQPGQSHKVYTMKQNMKESSWCDTDQCSLGVVEHLASPVDVIFGSGNGEHHNVTSFRWDINPRLRLFSYLSITTS